MKVLGADLAIYGLCLIFIYGTQQCYLKKTFQHRRAAWIFWMVLGVYLFIGLLDSLHWEISGHVLSLLDCFPHQMEAGYSAPMAAHLLEPQWLGNHFGYAPLHHWHVLGTDKIGQDVLYMVLKSIRTSLLIGTLTLLVSMPLGVSLGLMAGFYQGVVDEVIYYLYTTLTSIPAVLLIAAGMLAADVSMGDLHAQHAEYRLLLLSLILGLTGWSPMCRLVRAQALKWRHSEFVLVAKMYHKSGPYILFRHLWPLVRAMVCTLMLLDFSGLVLAEAVLSYVGVGVDPSTHSFGHMINAARLELARTPVIWWPLASAFVVMLGLVFCANRLGDEWQKIWETKASS